MLLVYHPLKEKNRDLSAKFEEFAKVEGRKTSDLVIGRYNGINESTTFKSPAKLPAILLFRRKEGEGEKEISQMKDIEEMLLKGKSSEEVVDRLRGFLKTN